VAERDADADLRAPDVLGGDDVGDRVVRGGAQRAAGFVVTNLLTAAGAVLLLRYLGVADFGRFGTVMALLAVVQGISDAGLTLTGSRELAVRGSDAERRELLAHVLGLRVALTAAGLAVALAFALVAGYDEDMVLGVLLAGIGVFLVSIQSAMLLPLSIELRNGTLALNEVLRQVLLVGGWAVLVVVGAGFLWFFGAQLLAGLVLLLVTPLLLARHHLVAPRWDRERIRELAAIGLPVAVSTVLGVLYLRLLVILMSVVSDDPDQLGYYVTSTRIVEIFVSLPFLLITVTLPVLSVAARDDRERLVYITQRTTELLLLGAGLIVLVLVVAARPIIEILGGTEYLPAVEVLRIQAFALITVFLVAAWNPTLLGIGHVRALVVASAIGLAAVLGLGLALIGPLEARGAAIAAVGADAALCLATYVALRRAGPGRELRGGVLGRIVLAALPAAGTALLLGGAAPLLAAALAAAVFVGAALILGAVPGELVDALRTRRAPASGAGR
jgi:O-antigen/teichoic acid export membrane protein